MTRQEYNQLQDTIMGLIEQERRYCADYVANNPADRKRRETISYYIISGFNNVLSTLTEQRHNGKIAVE